MKMASHLKFVLAVLSIPTLASAADLSVVNWSFEEPVVDPTFIPVSLYIPGWETAGPSGDIDVDGAGPEPARNSGTGIFINPAPGPTRFTNAERNQLGYIFTQTGEELFHTLSSTFQSTPGENVYQFTVGVGNASTPPAPTDEFLLRLFYTDAGQDPAVPANRNFVGTRIVTNLADNLSGTFLKDFTAETAPFTVDSPGLNRPINILITTVGAGGSQFDFDNVRVSAVPEPTALGLFAAGALATGIRRRRHI